MIRRAWPTLVLAVAACAKAQPPPAPTPAPSVSPPAAQGRETGQAGLSYGQGRQYSPTRTVTFHACADSDTAYIGGFHLKAPGCVPLDISQGGRPPARVVVSFFAGGC